VKRQLEERKVTGIIDCKCCCLVYALLRMNATVSKVYTLKTVAF